MYLFENEDAPYSLEDIGDMEGGKVENKMKKLKSFMIFFNTIVAVTCITASICSMVKGSSSENVLTLLIMAKLLMVEADIWEMKK